VAAILNYGYVDFFRRHRCDLNRNPTKIETCGLAEETEKNKIKKGGRRKSQNRYISPPCGGAISQPICTKFGEFVDLTDDIMPERWKIAFFL